MPRIARIPTGPGVVNRATTREVQSVLLGLQSTLEQLQGRLDRADMALEFALEDPGVFVSSPVALRNLDNQMRDLTGACDKVVGALGMIHHIVRENGTHPGPSGLHRIARAENQARSFRLALRWARERQAFNKFNPSELLNQLKRVLLDAGLDEVWQEIETAKVPRRVNDAWQNRDKT